MKDKGWLYIQFIKCINISKYIA